MYLVLVKKLAYELRKVHVQTVSEKVAEMNAQPLVDTGRHTSADVGPDTCQHTSKRGCQGRHTGRQTSRGGDPEKTFAD